MIKLVDPTGWSFDRPIVQMVKVSRAGLIGSDRDALLKVASHVFVDLLDRVKVAKDEIPIHLVALGATEAYGPNRNGDGFKEATCRSCHGSFRKNARWYRNHKNKDKAKSYGYIKASAYNEDMRRVELLAMLNATKEAADRNGGLVADEEAQKVAAGEDLPVSMACMVPFDVCSSCGNQAANRAEYCVGDTCKYGGCRDNLTKVADDGHILHVDNPNPTWFDMSKVFRPADRIAYGSHADYMAKAAAAGHVVGGAEMAELENVTAPSGVILWRDPTMGAMDQAAIKLAEALDMTSSFNLPVSVLAAVAPGVRAPLDVTEIALLGQPGTEKCAGAMAALAAEGIVLPMTEFASWWGMPHFVDEARQIDCNFSKLAQQNHRNPYTPVPRLTTASQRKLAAALRAGYSLDRPEVTDRAMRVALRGGWNSGIPSGTTKRADVCSDGARLLADRYALYKMAALLGTAQKVEDFNLTTRLSFAQNLV